MDSLKRFWSFLGGAIFFLLGVAVNFLASAYATSSASNPVEDIILSNIPRI